MFRLPKWLLGCAVCLAAVGVIAGFLRGAAGLAVSGSLKAVQLPIIMYHHILEDSPTLGDYVITPGQFEADLRYIKDQGFTTVTPSQVAAFARGAGSLPEKPIMITFDDGNKSTYVYAYPLLKKYGMQGALAVIGVHSEHYSEIDDHNVSYAHATWDELRELAESGVVEIGNHTYNMHEEQSPRRGTLRNPGEGKEAYRRALYDDLKCNQDLLTAATGKAPAFFAYPFGFIDKEADEVLKKLGFTTTLGVAERVDTITAGDPESAYKLGRFNRPYSADTKAFFDAIFSQLGPGEGTK